MAIHGTGVSPDMDPRLRIAIDHILHEFRAPGEQAVAIEELRSAYPHSVHLAPQETSCERRDSQTEEYDCFTFALNLIDCPERIAARKYAPRSVGPTKLPGIADALPGPTFLSSLQLPEQPSLHACGDADLVVYFDEFGNVQHAGKVVVGTIVSKWGMKGALWQHSLWEVPSSYGTSARFYSHRAKEYVRQQWLVYLGRLARRVSGFTSLVSVMSENQGNNLAPEQLLKLAANRAASQT